MTSLEIVFPVLKVQTFPFLVPLSVTVSTRQKNSFHLELRVSTSVLLRILEGNAEEIFENLNKQLGSQEERDGGCVPPFCG